MSMERYRGACRDPPPSGPRLERGIAAMATGGIGGDYDGGEERGGGSRTSARIAGSIAPASVS